MNYILGFKLEPSPCGLTCPCNDDRWSDEDRARCEDEAEWGIRHERETDAAERDET